VDVTDQSPIRRVAVRGADAEVLSGTPLEVVGLSDAEAVVTVGAEALAGAALTGPSERLLPVGVDGGLHGISRLELADAASALATGDYRTATHPILRVEVDAEQVARAAFDATLMTSEPARISEYSLTADGERLTEVRADGVCVAGSFGSAGYNNAAGGPLLAPGSGFSVVPIAPFTTRANDWVVPGPLEVAVERDEGAVSLFADDDEVGEVAPHEPVRVVADGTFDCLRPLVE
jgi:NAD+ kinase